jgi:adenosylhomocysteine nucleosidase
MAQTLLGMVTAFEQEAALVRRRLCWRHTEMTAVGRLWQGALYGQEVVLLRSGMGPARVTHAMTWLVQHYPLHGVINVGFAGGLQASLATGDAILPLQIRALATGAASACEDEVIVPDMHLAHCAATAAQHTALRHHQGTLLSVPEVVGRAVAKKSLGQRSGALAVDMESFSLGRAATAYALPFTVLRTIFDTCEDNMLFQANLCTSADGGLEPWRMWRYLAGHPRLLWQVPPLWRKVRRASQCLGRWLDGFFALLHRTEASGTSRGGDKERGERGGRGNGERGRRVIS